jgi:serine acetyltransferase
VIDLKEIQIYISNISEHSIFSPDINVLNEIDLKKIDYLIKTDYARYYNSEFNLKNLKYFQGLLATFLYRISRELYLNEKEEEALEYSSLALFLTNIELYYSAEIGEGFKINHGSGTVVGARTKIRNNVLLHQNVTLGDKKGRPELDDNVVVYPGAIIVGPIKIGTNVIIGANTFVDKSINPHTIYK